MKIDQMFLIKLAVMDFFKSCFHRKNCNVWYLAMWSFFSYFMFRCYAVLFWQKIFCRAKNKNVFFKFGFVDFFQIIVALLRKAGNVWNFILYLKRIIWKKSCLKRYNLWKKIFSDNYPKLGLQSTEMTLMKAHEAIQW